MKYIGLLTYFSSQPALSDVPASLLHLREEIGLAGDAWKSMGTDWQALSALWLRAEALITRSARPDLLFTQICKSAIPDHWKEWMNAKLMKTDVDRPPKAFGMVLTDYLKGVPSSRPEGRSTVMSEIWCRPGVTGIIGLLVCLHWQAKDSGAQNEWMENVKRVEHIYNSILSVTDL